MTSDSDDRAKRIADMRALLDFLEAHPDAPLPRYGWGIQKAVSGSDMTDDQGIAAVRAAAEVIGAEVNGGGDRWDTEHRIGSARYRVYYVMRDEMRRYDEHMKGYRGEE